MEAPLTSSRPAALLAILLAMTTVACVTTHGPETRVGSTRRSQPMQRAASTQSRHPMHCLMGSRVPMTTATARPTRGAVAPTAMMQTRTSPRHAHSALHRRASHDATAPRVWMRCATGRRRTAMRARMVVSRTRVETSSCTRTSSVTTDATPWTLHVQTARERAAGRETARQGPCAARSCRRTTRDGSRDVHLPIREERLLERAVRRTASAIRGCAARLMHAAPRLRGTRRSASAPGRIAGRSTCHSRATPWAGEGSSLRTPPVRSSVDTTPNAPQARRACR